MDVLSTPFPDQVQPQLRWELSFRPYLKYVEKQARQSRNAIHRNYLESIAALLKENPLLLEPVRDLEVLKGFDELTDLLRLNHVQPGPGGEEPCFAMGIPFPMQLFSYSQNFRRLMLDGEGCFRACLCCEFVAEEHLRKFYWLILEKCYKARLNKLFLPHAFLQLRDEGPERRRHYRLEVIQHFVELKHDGPLPELRQEWVDFATGLIRTEEELSVPLSLDNFSAEGFMIFVVREETEDVSLQELQKAVADMHTVSREITYRKVRNASLSLLGDNQMEFGLLPLVKLNNEYKYHPAYSQVSVIFKLLSLEYGEEELGGIYRELLDLYLKEEPAAWVHYDPLIGKDGNREIRRLMAQHGYRSLSVFPVWDRERLLGVVELASREPGAMDHRLVRKIELALPLYREYLTYELNGLNQQLNDYIMQRYTSIQPAVRWKFHEAAWQAYIRQMGDQGGSDVRAENIRFENLYPFYGAVDIRNSSVERLNAVRQDLWLQLEYLQELLEMAGSAPEVRERQRKLKHWQQLINLNITLEEEADLRDFLEGSIHFVRELRQDGRIPEESAMYFEEKMLDESSDFHAASWGFEQSLQRINEVLKLSLEQAESRLQEQIPHFFEKFKADGWEFNLYAGESIAPWRPFTQEDADLLCRWQLDTMIEMARASHRVRPRLQFPLETTQLILVHGNKVNISYRTDEQRFDVDGASSIRYEVIKKRIDKVRLRNSDERLTQPGTIGLVYVHSRNAVYYRKQLQQLVREGKLLPGIEQLELEDLQGISGLKALRVRISF